MVWIEEYTDIDREVMSELMERVYEGSAKKNRSASHCIMEEDVLGGEEISGAEFEKAGV